MKDRAIVAGPEIPPAARARYRFFPEVPLLQIPVRIACVFSGQDSMPGGFGQHCAETGASAVMFSSEASGPFDLADDLVWGRVLARLRSDEFDGCLLAPPAATFGGARRPSSGGLGGPPRRLRGPLVPEVHGLPDIRPAEKEAVRRATLLALRATEAASHAWLGQTLRLRRARHPL